MTVTVNNNVTPTFTNPGPICSGATLTLPTTSTNSITGTWSPAPNNTATTTYTFTPNGGGCATSTTMTVVIDNLTAPIFTNPGPICNGTALTLPTTSNNGVSGTWSPSVNNTTTTTYTFTPNSGLCAVTANLTVTVNQKTTPSFTNPGPICQGGTFTLPAVSNDGTPGTWSPVVNNMATTTYTFTPNTGECANTQTLSVVVNPPVTPAFTNPGPICTGDNLILPNASNNGISGTWSPAINNTATTTYTFTPNVGQCANTQTMTVTVGNLNPPVFTIADTICAGINFTLPATSNNGVTGMWSPAFNNTATTTYTFVPDPNQCANTLNKTVYVKAVPTLIVNASSNTICNNDTVKIKVQSMPSGAAIAWTATNNNTTGASNGTGTVVNQTIKLINKTNSGSVTYEFVGALNGCTSAPSYVTYTVNPPMATSTSVTSSVSLVEEGETTNLNVALNPYVPGVLYSWSPSNTLSCSDCPNPIATPDSSRCYYVTVSAPNTCPLTDSVCIKYRIKCGDIFVPTIFSPNGDGSNDVFKVYGRCLAKMQLHIYDRWGEQIFYSDDISEGWDGTYKGKLMNSGTFVYLLHVTTLYNETQELKGNVTLVR
jgi:gliding motility-associated-like protein